MTSKRQRRQMLLMAGLAVILTVCVVVYSEESFQAAVAGLKIWWEIVFPALLPFFILAELLMGLGVVHAMGVLMEPMMRPVFGVPGVGAFAMAMGLASGYPIGAKITGELRRTKLLTQIEGERLLAFTNTADPLFMIGAVAVGMFHDAKIGAVLAGAHYVSSITLGLIMRFYGRKEERDMGIKEEPTNRENLVVKAYRELVAAREKDGRSFGQLLGESITDSVNTLLLIGGFIILFSVITKILTEVGIVLILTKIIMLILAPLGIVESMVLPIIGGLFEITNGANLAAVASAPLFQRVMICSGIIAWSGLSVHAQVATMVNKTDIRMGPYIFARAIHAILAALATFLFLSPAVETIVPVNLPILFNQSFLTLGFFSRIGFMMSYLVWLISAMIFLSLVITIVRRIRIIVFRYRE